ncbi:hypothetical protein F3Y22_tig00110858pilonHSYRG00062 [Hibiscus syriacus]|uniref:Uncharacterized protein n=1 Tax=Hibiscus syriacus TaxID=106335 RepID=A0A6A2ZML0_HIBSY|nr:hypothetical protein F3Y22_tig00110858pilonHSYRG00062 [Hibiscus syriacus]
MDKGVVIQEIKNAEARLWSEKTQKEKGDSLQSNYVSELVSYASVSLKQNNVQELRNIWDSWKNDRKQKFSQRYGDIALLLHVKTDEPLLRALIQFWNPGYSCFTFNREDMVPTIEEYTTLLHCESIRLERVYIKHIKSQPFKNGLAKIAGVDEKWVTDRLRHKGNGEGIEWIHIKQLMKNHPDEWKTIDLFALGLYGLIIFPKILGCIDATVVELFKQLPRRVNPAPTILAETFRSLNHCIRIGGGRFIGCVQLLQVWIHSHFWKTNGVAYRRFSTTYSPLGEFITIKWHEVGYAPSLALRQYGARQFIPATYGLSISEFVYHGDNYKKMIKEVADSWKKLFRMDIVAARDMLTPDYVEWRRLRKNDNIPVPDCEDTRTMEEHLRELEVERYQWKLDADTQKDRADKLGKEQKKIHFELEDLRKGKFEGYDEQLKTTQRRLAGSQHHNQCLRIQVADLEKQHEKDGKTIAELEAILDELKKQASELQIVPFDGGLQWRFRWEQAQQMVKTRDVVIRDFLDQVQKAACHLHGLAREAGVVRQNIQPVTDEGRRLVNLLEDNMSQKEQIPRAQDTHHPHNTRTKKRQMEARMEKLEENMSRLQKELEDKMAQNNQSTLESIKKNQESLVDQIVAKLSALQQASAPRAGSFEGLTIPPTSQVVISPGVLPEDSSATKGKVALPGDSSSTKGKAASTVKIQTFATIPDNHPDNYHVPDFDEEDKAKKMEEKIRMLEDQMKMVKGDQDYYGVDAMELSLVPDLVLPPKFKVPEFEKFNGNNCPSADITMFCRKMTGYVGNDQLLIHCFQESLSGSAIRWYNQLNRTHIKTWKDLAKSFLEQYKHINDMRPDRVMLQSLEKKHNESFRQYAQRWRDLAVQVHPSLDEKETRKLFVQTLKAPYFGHLVAITSGSFSDLVMAGEMIELAIKQGKIEGGDSSKKSLVKNKEREINNVNTYNPNKGVTISSSNTTAAVPSGTSKQNQREPRKEREREQFDPIPMTYKELYQQLFDTHVVSPYPMDPIKPPYPRWFDENVNCEYHGGVQGHSIENCLTFKRLVQRMRNKNWITFNSGTPNVAQNPLPNHQETGINAVTIEKGKRVKLSVSEVKAPLVWVWSQMVKAGLLALYPDTAGNEYGNHCCYHNEEGHKVQYCPEFKTLVQLMMDRKELEFYEEVQDSPEADVCATGESSERRFGRGSPLVITPKAKTTTTTQAKVVITAPRPFQYKDSRQVPWKYECQVSTSKECDSKVGQRPLEPFKEDVLAINEPIKEEEVKEFLKFLKHSEYSVVEQLHNLPTRTSMLALLLNSEAHREALLKVLNQTFVPQNIPVSKMDRLVNNIQADNLISFSDDEIPSGGRGRTKALHITTYCKGHALPSVLIDNGSALNVMPLITLKRLPMDTSHMRACQNVVRAFDGTKREVIGKIEVPLTIGPATYNVEFLVMDIISSYNCLLGRPWIHQAGAVPSTLHQKVKFVIDGALVIINAEEDIVASVTTDAPYIEVNDEGVECSFRSLEFVNATFVAEGKMIPKPRLSKCTKMEVKQTLGRGAKTGRGFGKHLQGKINPVILISKLEQFGLGFQPNYHEKRKEIQKKRERRLARLTGSEFQREPMVFPPLYHTFKSGGYMFETTSSDLEVALKDLNINVVTTEDADNANKLWPKRRQRYSSAPDGEADEEAQRVIKFIKEFSSVVATVTAVSEVVPFLKWMDKWSSQVKSMKRISTEMESLIETWIDVHKLKKPKTRANNNDQDFIDVTLSKIKDDVESINGHRSEKINDANCSRY